MSSLLSSKRRPLPTEVNVLFCLGPGCVLPGLSERVVPTFALFGLLQSTWLSKEIGTLTLDLRRLFRICLDSSFSGNHGWTLNGDPIPWGLTRFWRRV